ncbi:MAG: sugar phosphate isomerase/epimerase family protein [Bacilli bacterium]
MKKCFTINPLRKTEDFIGYHKIIEDGLYDAIEIFYPEDETSRLVYGKNVHDLLNAFPSLKVVLHLPFNRQNDLCLMEKSEELIDKFHKIMVFAHQFNVKKLTMHLGYVNQDIAREVYLTHIVSVLKQLCFYANELGMSLMIENMPNDSQLGYAPEEILSIIEQVGWQNLGFIYDTGHAHVSEFPDLLYLDVLGKYLWHCHLNDNHGMKDEHLSFSKGNYDFSSFFKKTISVNFQGFYCLEMLFNDENDLRDYAKSFDEITKGLILK